MAIELIETKVDTDISRKTVVVFDSRYNVDQLSRANHSKILRHFFPKETLFHGVTHFTLMALRDGYVAPGLSPADLLALNPAMFVLDPNLIPVIPWYDPLIALLRNLDTERKLSSVKRIVVSDFDFLDCQLQSFAVHGISLDSIFRWSLLAAALEVSQFKDLVSGIA